MTSDQHDPNRIDTMPHAVLREHIAAGTHDGHKRAVADSGLMRAYWEAAAKHGVPALVKLVAQWVGIFLVGAAAAGFLGKVIIDLVARGVVK